MTDLAVDGRSARRDRNREAVVEAGLALVDEGMVNPTVEDITKRTGLSPRSIFRYFDSLDDLRQAVIERNLARVEPLLRVRDDHAAPLERRIKAFTKSRFELCATLEGAAYMARARASFVPSAAAEIERFRSLADAQTRSQFAPELGARRPADREETVMLINVVCSFNSWELLTTVHRRSRPQVCRAWARVLTALL